MQQQQMNACVKGLRDTCNSSYKGYKNISITHNIWREIAQTLGKDETL